jgi:hypothetical protein
MRKNFIIQAVYALDRSLGQKITINFANTVTFEPKWSSSLDGVVTRLQVGRMRNSGLVLGSRKFSFSPKCPDQLWSPVKLVFNGY